MYLPMVTEQRADISLNENGNDTLGTTAIQGAYSRQPWSHRSLDLQLIS